MVSINYSSREVCCKIVYYGPGLSGKTTNLQYVHAKVPGDTRGDLISLATEADRTLYFDFLPLNIGSINGFAARFQLYTVPGQVYYNATRKLVLRGVDGVVFVADSQPDKMEENIESLVNLEENLREYGYDINELPLVLQYNKRDLPGVLPVDEMDARLNKNGRACFEASATIGNGVFDTLKMVIKLVLEKAKRASSSRSRPVTAADSGTGTEAAAAMQPGPAAAAESAVSSPSVAPADGVEQPPIPVTSPAASRQQVTATVPPPVRHPEPAPAAGSDSIRPSPPQTQESEPVPDQAPAAAVQAPPRASRPFPGQGSKAVAGGRIRPTSFSPVGGEVPGRDRHAERQPGVSQASPDRSPSEPSLRQPTMAPPKRKRREQKKRGFFKRLFGIK